MLKKMKDSFNKLMSTTPDALQNSALVRKCEECTSPALMETDWNLHRQLCVLMNEGDVGCATAVHDMHRVDHRATGMRPRRGSQGASEFRVLERAGVASK
jgi:hypothetical protein